MYLYKKMYIEVRYLNTHITRERDGGEETERERERDIERVRE